MLAGAFGYITMRLLQDFLRHGKVVQENQDPVILKSHGVLGKNDLNFVFSWKFFVKISNRN